MVGGKRNRTTLSQSLVIAIALHSSIGTRSLTSAFCAPKCALGIQRNCGHNRISSLQSNLGSNDENNPILTVENTSINGSHSSGPKDGNDSNALSVGVGTKLDNNISIKKSSSWKRLKASMPHINSSEFGDDKDKLILDTAIPAMINMAIVPIVNSVDTYWVGRMGIALALAGQAAANQTFFSLFFLISFLPTITAPLVATAVASGDTDAAQSRVCESLFLCSLLGSIGMIILVGFPQQALRLVLANDSPSMSFAAPYLRIRALSIIPSLFSATGFAAYRGLLNTITPLKVSLATNFFNLVTDPLLIYGLPVKGSLNIIKGMGFIGAAVATAAAETFSGIVYFKLLLRRKLISISRLFKIPSMEQILPIIQGSLAMLGRQLTLNVAFLTASRKAQALDPTGVSAAAYGIVMQIYYIGVVMHLGIQSTAATLVPAAKATDGDDAARHIADKLFCWGSLIGVITSIVQVAALPYIVPIFSTLPEVQEAIKAPALISSFIHLLNGPVFAGEGVMLGLGKFKALAISTLVGVGIMVGCLSSTLGQQLNGILISLAAFHLWQASAVVYHHLRIGPLRRRGGVFDKIFRRKYGETVVEAYK